ncbi:MAG: alkaline phosphatase D family protein [Saprospiraceae bacterium]|nr:alkaline phosphatase D family protein [Saprospiraceae bacterium]
MAKVLRRWFFKKLGMTFLTLSFWQDLFFPFGRKEGETAQVYFTTGFKVSEVSETQATLWTRLCAQEKANPITHQRREQVFRHPIDFDEDQPVELMDGGVKAGAGWVKFRIFNQGEEHITEWLEVVEHNDYTVKWTFVDLSPNTEYQVELAARCTPSDPVSTEQGRFRTAPDPDQIKPVLMTTSTCQYFWSFDDDVRGFHTYDSMRNLKPDFFVQTGDYIYYDKPGPLAKNLEQARHKWHAMDAWSSIRDLYKLTPVFMIKDDHDLLKDDVYPGASPYGNLTFEDGLRVWRENAPVTGRPFRSLRWGKDLELWLMEGREFRTPNGEKDGPQKSIWGEEQKAWFKSTVEASDATFKLLISATPIVGPDRENKKDNHANQVFATEGRWLRRYLSAQKNLFVVNGDRHWQYVSQDMETGLIEFGSGPVSDFHAQGWKADDLRPEHRFLRLKGGFLSVSVNRQADQAYIIFSHHQVNGDLVHRERFNAV